MKKQELVIHCLGASNTRSSICGKDGDRFLYTQELNYPALLQQKLGCTVRNYGVGGANIARQEGRQDSYVERYPMMEEGANVVLVQGTGNDVALGVSLGTLSDTVDTTYYGALNTLVDGLYAKYPRAFILLITGMTREKDRERYEQYTAAMLEVARLKAVPVLDMYHHGLMNPCIPAIKALRMPDGAHMTLAGLELYTAQIIGFLRQVGALGD